MRVFVTVGTHAQQFDRLLKAIDEIAGKNKKLRVFGQTGNSLYKPKFFPYKEFVREPEYSHKFMEADVIVSHGGAGAIIHAMEFRKKLVIVPRLEKFSEHTNDHQLELAELLHRHKKAIAVSNEKDLEKAILAAQKFSPDFDSTRKDLIHGIEKWFSEQAQ